MEDITVYTIRETTGKNMFVREAIVNGLLTGIAIQREMSVAGKTVCDGALLAIIKINADKELSEMVRGLGVGYERLLSSTLFVGWEDRKKFEKEYFIYIGKGMIYVSRLYQELATAGLDHRAILIKSYDLIEKRMAELRAMI